MENTYEIEAAIHHLEKQNRWMRRVLIISSALWLIAIAGLWLRNTTAAHAAPTDSNSILRVRGLVVTDENGIDRVWIGAPLPNPPVFGKRYKRSVSVSGILLFDADGNERTGYVTTGNSGGNVFLSMDSVGSEIADYGARAGGGASLELHDGGSVLSLAASEIGPKVKMTEKGKTIFEQPSMPEKKQER